MKIINAQIWQVAIEVDRLEVMCIALRKMLCTKESGILKGWTPLKDGDRDMPSYENLTDVLRDITNQAHKLRPAVDIFHADMVKANSLARPARR